VKVIPLDSDEKAEEISMSIYWTKQSVVVATLALLLACPAKLRAQDAGSIPESSQQGVAALTGGQQSVAKSALCSAVQSHFPNPASANPSALSDPSVMSNAASSFAGSTHLSLSTATDMLKEYVAKHASDIFASCAANSATGGLTTRLPDAASLPQVPKWP
jgi:hypothetical protein